MARAGLITAQELASLEKEPEAPRVVELRQEPSAPGPRIAGSVATTLHAGFAQVREDRGLQYDVPTAEEFAATMGGLGITPETAVVFADDMGNRWSTRAYWLMRYYGHAGEVWVLDGGINAYVRAGLPISDDNAQPSRTDYAMPTTTDESIRASADDVLRVAQSDDAGGAICDTRTPQEHTGAVAMSGRGGHIPRSINVPWDTLLDRDGRFLSDAELRSALRNFTENNANTITYCQGGIRASLVWFVLRVLLQSPARLYAASWEEWAQRPDLPVST